MTAPDDRSSHPLDRWADGIRNGTDDAFRAVYQATADELASFAHGMVRNRSTAEDMVQQAFLELVRARASFRGGGESLRVWLFRSVRYRCLDELKRAGRRRERPSALVPDATVADGEPAVALDPVLESALAALSLRQRTLVVLRHVVGMSGEELAGVMGMTRSAVYAALSRAEKRLRAEVEVSHGIS